MNSRMREYLEEQFEKIADQMVDALQLSMDREQKLLFNTIHEIRRRVKYVEHAVMESANCDNCQAMGLTDELHDSSFTEEVK